MSGRARILFLRAIFLILSEGAAAYYLLPPCLCKTIAKTRCGTVLARSNENSMLANCALTPSDPSCSSSAPPLASSWLFKFTTFVIGKWRLSRKVPSVVPSEQRPLKDVNTLKKAYFLLDVSICSFFFLHSLLRKGMARLFGLRFLAVSYIIFPATFVYSTMLVYSVFFQCIDQLRILVSLDTCSGKQFAVVHPALSCDDLLSDTLYDLSSLIIDGYGE